MMDSLQGVFPRNCNYLLQGLWIHKFNFHPQIFLPSSHSSFTKPISLAKGTFCLAGFHWLEPKWQEQMHRLQNSWEAGHSHWASSGPAWRTDWWQGPHTKAAQGSGGLWGGHQLRGCKDKSASERRCWSFNCSGTVLDMGHESWAVQWDPAV